MIVCKGNTMNKSDKIYVAGHNGLIGSAIVRRLLKDGYINILTRNHAELDLTDQYKVKSFLERKPDYVFFPLQKLAVFLQTAPIGLSLSMKIL